MRTQSHTPNLLINAALVAIAVCIFSGSAAAAKITNTFYGEPQTIGDLDGSDQVAATELVLRKNGATSRTVTYKSRTKVAFFLTMECTTLKPSGAGIKVSILVDGLPLKQTDSDQTFCHRHDMSGPASHAISGMRLLNPGQHTYAIRVEPVSTLWGYTVDNLNLVMVAERP